MYYSKTVVLAGILLAGWRANFRSTLMGFVIVWEESNVEDPLTSDWACKCNDWLLILFLCYKFFYLKMFVILHLSLCKVVKIPRVNYVEYPVLWFSYGGAPCTLKSNI